jgi:cytochrome c-type biogenesis protein CcmE
VELTPRTGPTADGAAPGETAGPGLSPAQGVRPRSRRRLPVVVALLVIVGVAGFVIVNALGNATLFFYNADEAVAQQGELGTQRFRLQGTVVGPSVQRSDDGVTFDVTFNGVEVPVVHQGDPPELFQPDIPVVLEGRFADGGPVAEGAAPLFLSDRMLVKHTNEYDAKNEDRLRIAEDGGAVEGEAGQAGTP